MFPSIFLGVVVRSFYCKPPGLTGRVSLRTGLDYEIYVALAASFFVGFPFAFEVLRYMLFVVRLLFGQRGRVGFLARS